MKTLNCIRSSANRQSERFRSVPNSTEIAKISLCTFLPPQHAMWATFVTQVEPHFALQKSLRCNIRFDRHKGYGSVSLLCKQAGWVLWIHIAPISLESNWWWLFCCRFEFRLHCGISNLTNFTGNLIFSKWKEVTVCKECTKHSYLRPMNGLHSFDTICISSLFQVTIDQSIA